jgi:hypothetical protein
MRLVISLTYVFNLVLPLTAWADISCEQFTAIGDLEKQFQEYRAVIADHASNVATFGSFSKKKKALDYALNNGGLMGRAMGNSLALTHKECGSFPEKSFEEVAIDTFDNELSAISEEFDL